MSQTHLERCMPLLIVKLVCHSHLYPHPRPHQHLYPLYRSLNMKMKFKKYWGDLDKLNQILMVALVLDPQYKLGNLEFILKSRFENSEDAVKKKNEIKEILKKLHEEYAMPPLPPPPPPPSTQSSSYCSSDLLP
ncbi:unnamed protein product [Prunus armeniaca]